MEDEGLEREREAMRQAVPDRFAPGFAGRVMERRGGRDLSFGDVLLRRGWRMIPVGMAAAAALVVYVMATGTGQEGSLAERLLGLQPVTFTAIYAVSEIGGR